MKLVLDTKNEDFVKNYIPEVLKGYIEKKYSVVKAKKLNTHLSSYGIKQDVKEILLYAIDSLKITVTETGYTCEVDKNKNLPNTPFNIGTVVNLITYGNIEIKGYGIIIKAFEFVVNKLITLKKIYASKNGKNRRIGYGNRIN
jgi:hypothetical protein